MDPHCCRYVGSMTLRDGHLLLADVYAYTTMRGTPHEHVALNIRIGDDGPDYHNTSLEHARQSDRKLYAEAVRVYDEFFTRGGK
jgi:hypothetical protein